MTTTPDDRAERSEWLTERMWRLLQAAADRQPEDAVKTLTEIGDTYGSKGMFGICCALAETIRVLTWPDRKPGDGSLTGEMVGVVTEPGFTDRDDPHSLWACRFVAAHCNGDGGTTVSLFYGPLEAKDTEAHTGGVIALLAMAGDLARRREQELADQDDQADAG